MRDTTKRSAATTHRGLSAACSVAGESVSLEDYRTIGAHAGYRDALDAEDQDAASAWFDHVDELGASVDHPAVRTVFENSYNDAFASIGAL